MGQTTMKAIQVHQYGKPEVLRLECITRPEPQAGEVLVRVHAAGVLPADCYTRRGLFVKKTFPYIPGTAFAGVIEEVGPGVTDFQKGQAVCGRAPNGVTAQYVAVIVDERRASNFSLLAPKPETLSFDEAAALSGGATTAWTALFAEVEKVQAGQRVLIHAAAGGVGLFAIQFAKWKGAQVIGTASSGNVDFVRSLGADTVIDYTTTAFDDVVSDVDFVLDTMGGAIQQRSMRILKRGGALVSIYEPPSPELAQELGVHATKNTVPPGNEHLQQIVHLIDEGYARPTIQQRFSLYETHLAHELCETGHGRGRIIVHIDD